MAYDANADNGSNNPAVKVAHSEVKKRQNRRMSQFMPKEIKQLKQAFSWIDKDKNGTVDPEEIAELLKKFGKNLTKDEIGDIMADLDKNGDGVMDFEEFATLMDRRMSINSHKSEIQDTFDVFDKDKDGLISFNDLKTTLRQLGEDVTDQDVKDMIEEFDKKGDGKINFDEFLLMMASQEDDATKQSLLSS